MVVGLDTAGGLLDLAGQHFGDEAGGRLDELGGCVFLEEVGALEGDVGLVRPGSAVVALAPIRNPPGSASMKSLGIVDWESHCA